MLRGIRGAITIEENKEEEIIEATERLMREIIRSNDVIAANVASVLLSVTEDIHAAFPAKALRNIDGWAHVPVMCMREIPVTNALTKCIRVMVHYNTNSSQLDIHHVYLEKAITLRPDLNQE